MEKSKNYLLVIFISISVFFGVFYCSVLYTCAGQSTGEEVYLTHTHTGSCYQEVIVSCMGSHTSSHGQQYSDYHCSSCGKYTSHNVEADTCFCPRFNTSWQENGFTRCTICGTIHSTWGSGPPGEHTFAERQLVCKLSDGQRTAGIRLTADDSWTNQGVLLRVETNILSQELTNGGISLSWGGAEKLVGENGTYTVDAVNSAGQTVTASISVNCIDKTSPVINAVSGDTGNMKQNSIPISVDASDAESGLAEMAFSFDGGSSFGNNGHFTVVDGSEVICVVRDKAGNTATQTIRRSDFAYPPPPPAPTPVPTQTTPSTPASTVTSSTPQTSPISQGESSTHTLPQEKSSNLPRKEPAEKTSTKTKTTNSQTSSKMNVYPSDTGSMEDKETSGDRIPAESSNTTKVNREVEGDITIYRMKEKKEVPSKSSLANLEEKSDLNDEMLQKEIEEQSTAKGAWISSMSTFFDKYAVKMAGIILITFSVLWLIKKVWIQTVFLYCYNGGEEFRKLGLLRLKKSKKEFTLFLPDYLLDEAETPRYRLLIHKGLVKKYKKMDIVLQSEEHKLRQPLEECVDFVL